MNENKKDEKTVEIINFLVDADETSEKKRAAL